MHRQFPKRELKMAKYAILPTLPNRFRRHYGSRMWTILGALPLVGKTGTSRLYFLNVFLRPYRRSTPTVCCQPPERTELLSVTICRAQAKISAQVNSTVGSDLYPV